MSRASLSSPQADSLVQGDDAPLLLEARGVSKAFESVRALRGVDFAVRRGEIHALLGENGAGKSTLMNILFGLLRPDSGELRWKGVPVSFGSPQDAAALGIGMVHQHFALIPTFTVAENLALGMPGAMYNPQVAARRVIELCDRVGLAVNPNAKVSAMSVGERQRVEILKALSRDAELLILDEPTGVLAPQEMEELFGLVERLAKSGSGIVFITHKLAEMERLADTVTVLRRGERVLNGPASAFSPQDLARAMVGEEALEDPDAPQPVAAPSPGAPVLKVEGLRLRDDSRGRAETPASFTVREGETLGIAGVEGSGQTELAEALTGLRPARDGVVTVVSGDGEAIRITSPSDFLAAGGAHIPEDRRSVGLALSMPIWENLILEATRRPPLRRGPWLNLKEARRQAEERRIGYDIRAASVETLAGALSGGNQQKVVVAREMSRLPRLLVAVNPTRGLDLRSTAYVREQIRDHQARGGATVLISSELEELFALAGSIGALHAGELVAILPSTVSREELGLWMTRGRA